MNSLDLNKRGRRKAAKKVVLTLGVIFSILFLLSFSLVSAFNFPTTTTTTTISISNGTVFEHNNLTDKQGGSADEYYHLTSSEYTSLQSGITNWITNSVSNLVNYYTKTDSDLRYIQSESDPLAYNGSLVPFNNAQSNLNLGNNNFSVNSSTLFVNTNTGNVGIGTTSPQSKLEVNGSINISGTSNKLVFPDGTTLSSNSSLGSGSGTITGSGATNYVALWNGTTSINRSNIYQGASGNIGIGTSSSLGAKLNVADTSGYSKSLLNFEDSQTIVQLKTYSTKFAAFNPVSSATSVGFLNADASAGLFIEQRVSGGVLPTNSIGAYLASGWPFVIKSATNEILYAQSTGNVGIGTTNPGAKLQISESAVARSYSNSVLNFSSIHIEGGYSDTTYSGLTFSSGGGGGAAVAFNRDGSYGTEISFWTNTASSAGTSTERMRINKDGLVGIGTTSPQQKLHVNGSIMANGSIYSDGQLVCLANGTNCQATGSTSAGWTNTSTWTNTSLSVGIGSGTPVNLDLIGNFTVHTDTDSWILQYARTDNTQNGGIKTINNNNPQTGMAFYTMNTARLMIDNTGLVGIGTTSPQKKLDVVGDINATGSMYAGGQLVCLANGTNCQSVSNAGAITGGGTSGYISRFNGTGSINNSVIFQNGTNIGIGTNNVGAKLDVDGSIRLSGTLTFTDGANTSDVIRRYATDHWGHNIAIEPGNELIVAGGDGASSLISAALATGTTEKLYLAADDSLEFWTSLQDYNVTDRAMVIDTSQRVGIGTASPGYRLEVNGTTKATRLLSDNIQIVSNDIHENPTNGNAVLYINRLGYGEGYTQFRDTGIGDGKGNTLLFVDGSTGLVGIGTTSPSYKLTVGNGSNTNYSLISAYFEGNITSAGYITRTSIYDKSSGSALDKIKDASEYVSDGKINHSSLIGYTTWITNEIDYSKPVIENIENEICEDILIKNATQEERINQETNETEIIEIPAEYEKQCHNETEEITTYPFTKEVLNEGQNLETQINTLQQAIYELKLENQNLKSRLDFIEGIKGTTIITEPQIESKSWWEFWK